MLDLVTLVAGAGLPALVLVVWFYRMDRARPEPLGLVGKSVLLGFLSAVPAVAIEMVVDLPAGALPGILGIAWTSFVTAALVEEGVKLFFLKRFALRHPAFDELMDGIVYAVCVSLGFAFAENLLYGLGDRSVLVLRAFTAVPMHAFASGAMGYWLGAARRERDPGRSRRLTLRGLRQAVLIHGMYDFFLFTGSALALLSLAVLAGAGLYVRRLVRQARAADDAVAASLDG